LELFRYKIKDMEKLPKQEIASEKEALEKRLQNLLGKKVESFEVDGSGKVVIKFEDNFQLAFTSWNAFDDTPGLDDVEVTQENSNFLMPAQAWQVRSAS